MIRNRSPIRRIVPALAVFLVAALAISVPAMAQESPEPASGAVEGIKVHGHWEIEVRNLDGTFDTRREFDNALNPFGAESLARLLGRTMSVGLWQILLVDDSGGGPCELDGQPRACGIQEPTDSRTDPRFFNNLVVEVVGPPANEMVLSGTATAQRDGTIAIVRTFLYRCTPDLAPDDPPACQQALGDQFAQFTFTTLASPVSVVAGQQILVTVTMSFS